MARGPKRAPLGGVNDRFYEHGKEGGGKRGGERGKGVSCD
jgi:hypothetical protein